MSNIVTVDEIKKKKGPDAKSGVRVISPFGDLSTNTLPTSNTSNSHFHGAGRSVSGEYVAPTSDPLPTADSRTSPLLVGNTGDEILDPEIASAVSSVREQYQIPKELSFNFWSLNFGDKIPNFSLICAHAYCPCCVGQCCSDNRKNDWKKLLKTITFYLMVLQLILYIAMVAMSKDLSWELDPDLPVLEQFGANGYIFLKKYHYHRLLSYILLHGSIIHIFVNTFSQFLFVLPLETAWGTWRFLAVYIITGIIGGLCSGVQKTVVSVGASCSILGIMGAFTTLIFVFWTRIGPKMKAYYVFWLMIMPFEFVATSFLPNVDWVGHIGGFLGGLFAANVVFFNLAPSPKFGKAMIAVGVIGIGLCLIVPLCLINLA